MKHISSLVFQTQSHSQISLSEANPTHDSKSCFLKTVSPTNQNPAKKRRVVGSNLVECLTIEVYLKKVKEAMKRKSRHRYQKLVTEKT